MPLELRIAVGIICVIFLLYTLYQVKLHRLMLRFSLLWIALSIVIFALAIFPQPIFALSSALGFDTASNFIFLTGFFFVLLISLSHARAISRETEKTKCLTQQVALLEKRLEDMSKR
ncbi:DUF2304 domain-containing protein [Adlercreutzia sp. ZJ304]|uniref:DUF2304 domain-containing protein n=1 Tax=Adlercreutzia sp. ZJ304 TaxID=2709791 RepID=UPI0013EAE5E7|nr:DUF2304 domain-containing protein [Adlercreutzia sp. ZJ304]